MFKWFINKIFGTKAERDLKKLQPFVAAINAFEPRIKDLSDAGLRAKTAEFKEKLGQGAHSGRYPRRGLRRRPRGLPAQG